MEAQEERVGGSQITIKGKRTKRQRLPSPLALTMSSSSSSAARTDNSGGYDRASTPNSTSPTTSSSTQEDHDMANCLILLAQGNNLNTQKSPSNNNNNNNLVGVGQNLYQYQCKTCDRSFPSFQALGGHRASHKKPKPTTEEKQVALSSFGNGEINDDYNYHDTTTLSLQLSNTRALYATISSIKSKVHECSICGAEFSSGQALGGHMRRHRTFVNTSTSTLGTKTSHEQIILPEAAKKPKNVDLKLDLNLPADPEDDLKDSSEFQFKSKEQVLAFSASPLVDCRY